MLDAPTEVTFSKKGISGAKELEGAVLKIIYTDEDGEEQVLDTWTSTSTPHTITKQLIVGKEYIMREETAPDGYLRAEEITFIINEQGQAVVAGAEEGSGTVTMQDDWTKVTISKKEIADGPELEGAYLEIFELDEDGNEVHVYDWISEDTPHQINAELAPGKQYYLRETIAPKGYAIAETIAFTITETGDVQAGPTMLDAPTEVTFSKKGISGAEELKGALLRIIDAQTGEDVIEPWVSKAEPLTLTGVLVVGRTYIMREETAPDGYLRAEEITFIINEQGQAVVAGAAEGSGTVTMQDDWTKVEISKRRITGSAELPGATLKLIDAKGKVIETWESGKKPHLIEARLVAGAKYTLVEITAPKGFKIAESITFTVNKDGKLQTVIMRDKYADSILPKTGDGDNMALWIGMMALSLTITLTGTVLLRKKKGA